MTRLLPFSLILLLSGGPNCVASCRPASLASSIQANGKQDKAPAKDKNDDANSEAEGELQKALARALNDHAALVRELEDYLRRFPDSLRKTAIYRALVEAARQIRDDERALDYAERTIALAPDDLNMMLLAVDMLEKQGDDAALRRAAGYTSRVLDHVEKATPDEKSPQMSVAEWEFGQEKLRMTLHLLRGRIEMRQRDYEAATQDYEAAYMALPNAEAALRLGEILEIQKDYDRAVEQYVKAFVQPEAGEAAVDRHDVRRKLGNLWILRHGNEAGLGEKLLAAFDELETERQQTPESRPNAGAQHVSDFVLRGIDGPPLRLAEFDGKTLVLNFWATWCGPCREMEPLFEKVMGLYKGDDSVVFLAVSGDEDESRVAPYVAREKMRVLVVFDDGLSTFLGVRAYPTLIILDQTGKIAYHASGFSATGFIEELTAAIERAKISSSE